MDFKKGRKNGIKRKKLNRKKERHKKGKKT